MRALVLAVLAALTVSFADEVAAQVAGGSDDLRIVWEVKNRFRLFRREADFQRQVDAERGDGVLGAEHRLEQASDGRGWAQETVGSRCVDLAGNLLPTCQRDGQREDYLDPQDHRIGVRLTGPIPPGATCTWSFDDGTPPPQQASVPCTEEVRLRVRYGKPTNAAVGITRPDNNVDSVTTEIRVRDLLIAGLGDSVAAGEGNPDEAVKLADEGFCFRRFLGTNLSEYFRPSRVGYGGNKACEDNPAGTAGDTTSWTRHGARWLSPACHRSLYSYQARVALELAVESPHIAVTFVPLACTGASIADGLLGSQRARECPPSGSCPGSVPGQVAQFRDMRAAGQRQNKERTHDRQLLTIGANDIEFSGLVADVIIASGVERVLFQQGGLIATVPDAQKLLDRDVPAGFTKLRAALKPLVGGDLSRVVYVSYGSASQQGSASCPGGRDGLDVHPAFTANATRMRQVTEFFSGQFLPRLKAIVSCEAGGACREPATDRMSFVDSHQAAFRSHSICAHAAEDPPFDRECFSAKGDSFDPDPVTAPNAPLTCGERPSDFRPYASRARWIRTANDSYFTAMTFPQGLPLAMQPNSIHDATWGAISAVYGGAVHPTAEGHAAMADAALPAARLVLGLRTPSAISVSPLPSLLPGR